MRRVPVIVVVEDDWRTRHFICTVLKYSINAEVIEVLHAGDVPRRTIDLLISNVELDGAKSGIDVAREIAIRNPAAEVLLMSGRVRPPCDLHADWMFLSIPFPTATFLNCVNQLCGAPSR